MKPLTFTVTVQKNNNQTQLCTLILILEFLVSKNQCAKPSKSINECRIHIENTGYRTSHTNVQMAINTLDRSAGLFSWS